MTGYGNKVVFGGGTQLRVNPSKFESLFLLHPVEQFWAHNLVREVEGDGFNLWGILLCFLWLQKGPCLSKAMNFLLQ